MGTRTAEALPLPITKSDRAHLKAEALAARVRAQAEELDLRLANDERREAARLAK